MNFSQFNAATEVYKDAVQLNLAVSQYFDLMHQTPEEVFHAMTSYGEWNYSIVLARAPNPRKIAIT